MNIEKIRNYNQKMLAIFSTAIVIIAAIGLISLLIFVITEIIPDNKPDTNVLLSDIKIDQLKQDSLHQQIISFNTPELIDTASLVYIIPVNVKTLSKPEELDKQILNFSDINKESGSGSSGSRYDRYYYGAFNNIIIFDYKNNLKKMVCNTRLIGTDLQSEYFPDEIILTFTGCENDSDKDNQITLKDLQDLFIYSMKEKVLKQIRQPDSTVESYKYVPGEKDILITFGFDRNKNNLFENQTEPTYIMKYDYSSGELISIVDNNLNNELQAIIDNK
jgi:hypothetical protein